MFVAFIVHYYHIECGNLSRIHNYDDAKIVVDGICKVKCSANIATN